MMPAYSSIDQTDRECNEMAALANPQLSTGTPRPAEPGSSEPVYPLPLLFLLPSATKDAYVLLGDVGA